MELGSIAKRYGQGRGLARNVPRTFCDCYGVVLYRLVKRQWSIAAFPICRRAGEANLQSDFGLGLPPNPMVCARHCP